MIKINTLKPIALDSPDHLYPLGTAVDNHTSEGFINEVEQYFENKTPLKILDLGCSGGQMIVDFAKRNHFAIGLEGSNYSIIHQRPNWPEYHEKNLFTCDISEPFTIEKNSELILFDVITAWEVLEHIHPDKLEQTLKNIYNHLETSGLFCATISTIEEVPGGPVLHQSVFPKQYWIDNYLSKYFIIKDYFFNHNVRDLCVQVGSSFAIIGIKK